MQRAFGADLTSASVKRVNLRALLDLLEQEVNQQFSRIKECVSNVLRRPDPDHVAITVAYFVSSLILLASLLAISLIMLLGEGSWIKSFQRRSNRIDAVPAARRDWQQDGLRHVHVNKQQKKKPDKSWGTKQLSFLETHAHCTAVCNSVVLHASPGK